jgi:hypothetical protein
MAKHKSKGTVSIQHLLESNNNTLAALHQRISDIQMYQDKLKAILPTPLCDHFILANIDEHSATLHTDNSAWAARLRFKIPEILDCIRKLCDVDPSYSIRIKVIPPENKVTLPESTLYLSDENAQLIRDTASSITDPVLRDALIRLSRHKS